MRRRNAFTLIELLVVITIILAVSVIALPTVLSGLRERAAGEAARLVQAALAGARDAAIHGNGPRGIRLLPDPSLPLQYLASGQIDPSKALVSSKIVSLEPAPPYKEGFVDASPALPAGFSLPVPALLVVEHARAPDGSPNVRTSWFWNLRVGDQIRLGQPQVITHAGSGTENIMQPTPSGNVYTVVGPMVVGPDAGNSELFVNFGNPGSASPFQAQVGNVALNLDFLYLVNGKDDNGDGLTDEGWDGVDNNLNGVTDEVGEWEPERWLQTFNAGSTNLTYRVERRPMPSQRSIATTMPAGTVIDMTSWASTRERSRVRVNPYTGAVDLMIQPDGTVSCSTPYASPASFSLADSFTHLWIADIQDIHDMLPPSANAFRLPMPVDTPGWSPSSPALKGASRIVTLARSGRLSVTDPAGSFSITDISAPFRRGQTGK